MYNLLRSNSVLTHQHSELDDYGHRKTSLGLTYVSIGHRPTIQQYHVKQLRLTDTGIDVTDVANSTFGTPSTEPPLLLNIASANTPTVASSTSETDIL